MIKILIVDDNVPALTMAVIRSLSMVDGFELHLLSFIGTNLPPFRFSRFVKTYKAVEVTGDEDTAIKIRERALHLNANILLPIKEKTIRIVAERIVEFAAFINVPPMPQFEVLEKVRNKMLLDNLLYEKGMILEKPILLSHFLERNLSANSLKFPFLIKPIWGSGGRGISLIHSARQLSNFHYPEGFVWEDFMVQPYFDGQDIDISFLAVDGVILNYTIQQGLANKNRLKYSKTIEFVRNEQLLDITTRFVREIGFSGIAHLDFRYNPKDTTFRLIDFNARYWSTLLGSVVAGVNFPELACRLAMGYKAEITHYNLIKYRATPNLIEALFASLSGVRNDLKILLRDPMPSVVGFFASLVYYQRHFLTKYFFLKRSKAYLKENVNFILDKPK